MNTHVSLSVDAEAGSASERLVPRLHAASGRLIEKCAEAEQHILALLRAGDGAEPLQPKAPLICKMRMLRAATELLPASARKKKLLQLLDELQPLAELRTELAHSTMSAGLLEGDGTVFLKNAAEHHKWIDRRVAITAEGMKEAHRALSDLVNRLRQYSAR